MYPWLNALHQLTCSNIVNRAHKSLLCYCGMVEESVTCTNSLDNIHNALILPLLTTAFFHGVLTVLQKYFF